MYYMILFRFSEFPFESCNIKALFFMTSLNHLIRKSLMKDWSAFGVALWVHLQSLSGLSLPLLPPAGYALIDFHFESLHRKGRHQQKKNAYFQALPERLRNRDICLICDKSRGRTEDIIHYFTLMSSKL